MAVGHAKTLDDYRKLLQDAQSAIWQSIKAFGELLVQAKKELPAEDWFTLWDELRLTHREAELRSAIAVGEGGLDERLFPSGVTHSKVLNMTRHDQQRLLNPHEKFEVYSDHSPNTTDAQSRSWPEMTRDQRNRLIADKGGRILPLAEQKPPKPKGMQVQKVEIYNTATYRPGDGYLTLRNGLHEGRINLSDIRASVPGDVFGDLIRDMQNGM